MPPSLLCVYHSRTSFTKHLASHLLSGARAAAASLDSPLNIRLLPASSATAADLLAADGYLFAAPENLGSLSGAFLEFLHEAYYPCFDAREGEERSLLLGRPYAGVIGGGSDGTSAARQLERICTGWRLREVKKGGPLVVRNGLVQTKENILMDKGGELVRVEDRERLEELGGLVAATMLLGED